MQARDAALIRRKFAFDLLGSKPKLHGKARTMKEWPRLFESIEDDLTRAESLKLHYSKKHTIEDL